MHWWLPVGRNGQAYATNLLLRATLRSAPRLSPTSLWAQPSSPNSVTFYTKRQKFRVQTLDPSRLDPSQFMDFSGRAAVTARFVDTTTSTSPWKIIYCNRHRFPPGTQGFLYYHHSSSISPTAGSVRFRITESQDPATFRSGTDLLLPTELPWQIPLLAIAQPRRRKAPSMYEPVRRSLLADQLISHDALEKCAKIHNAIDDTQVRVTGRIVQSLDDTFSIRFDRGYPTICLVADGIKQSIRLSTYWHKNLPNYSGSAICRFERSTLPAHQGTRTVVLRIVKITSPVKQLVFPNPYPEPTEGSLIMRIGPGNPRWPRSKETLLKPWSINVDKTRFTAFRKFFEDE